MKTYCDSHIWAPRISATRTWLIHQQISRYSMMPPTMVTGLPPGSGLPDVNRGPRILGAITTTTILALITVVMRLYVRIWMLRKPGFDDYFMIASMVNPIFLKASINIALTFWRPALFFLLESSSLMLLYMVLEGTLLIYLLRKLPQD